MKKWLPQYTTREPGGSGSESADNWLSLKNRYAARRLWRYSYYSLVTGDYSVLKNSENKHFSDLLLEHAVKELDINLLPVLRRISADAGAGESLQQRASEAVEILGECNPPARPSSGPNASEQGKRAYAMALLASERSPGTTEILRLLRDKSVIQKRYALYIIGKFGLADMLPEVCGTLDEPGLAPDACAILHSFGSRATGDLQRLYLATSGHLVTGRHVLRLLSENCIEENRSFLISLLGSSQRNVREKILKFLTGCRFRAKNEEKPHLYQLITETGRTISWIVSLRTGLGKGDDNSLLAAEIGNEFLRWRDYLEMLVYVTLDEDELSGKYGKGDEIPVRDWLREILPDNQATEPDDSYYRKLNRKLSFYFPSKIQAQKRIQEDIINCDYNLLSLFTKACALRNISVVDDDELADSVAALLFSPEEILREEAARVFARSDNELFINLAGRIQGMENDYQGNIVHGVNDRKELIFEKVSFLASRLPEIRKDELLLLAGRMRYCGDLKQQTEFPAGGSVLWLLKEDNQPPQIWIFHDNSRPDSRHLFTEGETTPCYILPLSAVEDFDYRYPGSSFGIYKLIDDNEA